MALPDDWRRSVIRESESVGYKPIKLPIKSAGNTATIRCLSAWLDARRQLGSCAGDAPLCATRAGTKVAGRSRPTTVSDLRAPDARLGSRVAAGSRHADRSSSSCAVDSAATTAANRSETRSGHEVDVVRPNERSLFPFPSHKMPTAPTPRCNLLRATSALALPNCRSICINIS